MWSTYSLFDTAVNSWLIEQRLLDVAGGERIGLVVETGCRYFAEIAFPDTVAAGLRVARIGTSSVRYELGLFRNDEDLAAAEGFFVHVYVERQSRRPLPLDAALRRALGGIAVPEAGLPPGCPIAPANALRRSQRLRYRRHVRAVPQTLASRSRWGRRW